MPATEKTWRHLPLMHTIFGVSCVAMLLSTVWMLAADYNREWKVVQSDYRRVERTMLDWRTSEVNTHEHSLALATAETELKEVRAKAPAPEYVDQYRDALALHQLIATSDTSSGAVESTDTSAPSVPAPGVDGRLTRDEMPSDLKEVHNALDASGDGQLDFDEGFRLLAQPASKQSDAVLKAATAIRAWGAQHVPNIGLGLTDSAAYTDIEGTYKQLAEVPTTGETPEERAALLEKRTALRKRLLTIMNAYAVGPRDHDDVLSRDLKAMRANRDAANSANQLAITAGKTVAERARLIAAVNEVDAKVDRLALAKQQSGVYRGTLEKVLAAVNADEVVAKKKVSDLTMQVTDLKKAIAARQWNPLELPILDAFNSPIKIQQNWLPDLKVNYNLAWVARFDRCITCHQGIDKSMPGAPNDPAFLKVEPMVVTLPTPKAQPVVKNVDAPKSDQKLTELDLLLRQTYGLDMAANGLWPNQATIDVVWDVESAKRNGFSDLAARAGLRAGDVIAEVNGTQLTSRSDAFRYLLESVEWGKPLSLTIHRGLPHPFATHPRLDLYLGSFSPHKIMDFGCTVCHQGQGSATQFKWVSHTPNTPNQQEEWSRKHGWFSNHDWPFLMRPSRFVESSCIKCHHEIAELEPSAKFPEPPAPKVVAGYNLIREYGCFGCHEINGYDNPQQRNGPDLRAEPVYFAAAQQLLNDPYFQGKDEGDAERAAAIGWAKEVIAHPERTEVRKRLSEWVRKDLPKQDKDGKLQPTKLKYSTHIVAVILGEDNETPGKLRKVGPSLRYVGSKVDEAFLYDWIRNPKHFRPSTKMPRFYGLHDHLAGPDPIGNDSIRDWRSVAKAVAEVMPKQETAEKAETPTVTRTAFKADDAKKADAKKADDHGHAPADTAGINAKTPVGRIVSRLPADVRRLIPVAASDSAEAASRERIVLARNQVAAALNGLLSDDGLYDAEAFAGLSTKDVIDAEYFFKQTGEKDATKTILKRSPGDLSAREVQWVNRLLIEAAFPGQVQPTVRLNPAHTAVDKALRYETIEAYSAARSLLSLSQPFEYASTKVPAGDVERGKIQFQTRGCLACHSHSDPSVIQSKAHQGPELAKLGAKLTGEKGKQWLYTWLKDPVRYHARTAMPNLFLDPVEIKDKDGKVTSTTDPAADITAFLLSFQDYKPFERPKFDNAADNQSLDELVLINLQKNYTERQSIRYLKEGIPEEIRVNIKGDDALLSAPVTVDKKLDYLGRRTISKLGCVGCHDVPGYEDSKPIGTALNSWGRKETSQLAFEQIAAYLGLSHGGHGGGGHAAHGAGHDAHGDAHGHDAHGDAHGAHAAPVESEADKGYFLDSLSHHHREGFIWQKLREPRSYDFQMVNQKPYDDRLKMPQFNFSPTEREAIITFVLGLVAEPSEAKAARYVYKAQGRAKAIQEGKKVLDKFNCTGCHTLEMDRWRVAFDPVKFAADPGIPKVPAAEDYPILHPYFTDEQLAASKKPDRTGLAHVELEGVKLAEEIEDEENGNFFFYTLWKPAAMGGLTLRPTQQVPLRPSQIVKHWPAVGGEFTRLVMPLVVSEEKKVNPNAKADDAWSWLPPPLLNEGKKVQTEWLYRFLLEPYPIRPAVVLRMPKFNLSQDESRALVNYFAAVDGVEFPYEHVPEREESYRHAVLTKDPKYFNQAFSIVADANVCTKCHRVADYIPTGDPKAQAPDLARVFERLRPDFLAKWLARPKEMLPYTGMPVNFPLVPPKPGDPLPYQDKFPGTPLQQVHGVRDLLLNFDAFVGSEVKMKDRIKLPPPMPPAANAAPANPANVGNVAAETPGKTPVAGASGGQ